MHTTWSDGALSLRELVDLYGRTGDFDVIAITDHILREKDWLGRAGRLATLGRRSFSVTEETGLSGSDSPGGRAGLAGTRVAGDPGRRGHEEPLSGAQERAHHRARYRAVHQRRSVAGGRAAGNPAPGWDQRRLPSAAAAAAALRARDDLPVGAPERRRRPGGRLGGGQPRRPVRGDQSQALSSTIPTSRAATSTSRSTCTRGRRWSVPRRTGNPSRKRCGATWTLRSPSTGTGRGTRRARKPRPCRSSHPRLPDRRQRRYAGGARQESEGLRLPGGIDRHLMRYPQFRAKGLCTVSRGAHRVHRSARERSME